MANEQMGMLPAPNSPEGMAVLDQMRQSISPKQFSDEMLAGASQVDPQAVAKFKQELDSLDVPPDVLEALNNLVDEILANPQGYAEIRKKYMDQGIPEDLLPAQFDPHFFAALNMAIDQLIGAPAGEQAFAKGGIAELKPIAKAIAGYGRNGDTMLAHITPAEARMLRRRGGSGTINPATGLPEFFNLFKAIGKAVKSFVNSTVGRIVTTVALGFFLGPAAASMVGIESAAGVAAMSGFVGSAGATLLGGGSLSQALKAGAIGGLTAGVMGGVTQGFDAAYTGPTTVAGQWDKLTGAAAAPAGIAPTSAAAQPGITPDVTNLPPANPADFGATQAPGAAPTPAPTSAAPASATQAPGGAPVPPELPAQIGQPPAAPVTGTSPIDVTNLPPANPADFGATPGPIDVTNLPPANPADFGATPGPIDVTATPGPLAEPKLNPTGSTSLIDQAKDFYSKNLSPSGIQEAAKPAAEQAGKAAMDALQARVPTATPAMLEQAYQTAYKAAMPGVLGTYGPAVGAGLGIMGLAGGFNAKNPPESALKGQLMKSATQRIAEEGTGKKYYLQGLPGVKYDNAGIPVPGEYLTLPTAQLAAQQRMNLPSTIGGLAALAPKGALYSSLPGSIGSPQVYQPYNTAAMYTNLVRGYATGGDVTDGVGAAAEKTPEQIAAEQKAAADAAALAAQQKAARDAVDRQKDLQRAAGWGTAYANINAGLAHNAPEANPMDGSETGFGARNRQAQLANLQQTYGPMLQQQQMARNQQTGIMASGQLPRDISRYSPEQKGNLYMQMARQGLTDPQIRAAAENRYGAQSDADWNILQGVVGQMQQPGSRGVDMDKLVGQQVASSLPSNWGTYSPDQKINYFNQHNVTVGHLLGAGVTQPEIDWMLQHGYTGGAAPKGIADVSIQGGLDQYGNLYGSKDYHYGRGPTPTQPTPVSDPSYPLAPSPSYPLAPSPSYPLAPSPSYPLAPSPWAPSASDYSQIVGAGTGNSSMADKQALYQRLRASGGTDQQIRSLAEKLLGPQTNEAWSLLSQAPATQPKAMLNAGGIAALAMGGYPRRTGQISGPGTETSDSIPAMLSDGEFVMTAKAVKGAGKGDRRAGAKKMYKLMHQLERNAQRG